MTAVPRSSEPLAEMGKEKEQRAGCEQWLLVSEQHVERLEMRRFVCFPWNNLSSQTWRRYEAVKQVGIAQVARGMNRLANPDTAPLQALTESQT